MLPFWLDLGALSGLHLTPFIVMGTAFVLLPTLGLGARR